MIGDFIDTMSNIEYGILIAVIIDAVLLATLAYINDKNSLNVLSYVIAAVLLVPLTFQMSRLIGACYISDSATAINNIVGYVSPTLSRYVSSVTSKEIGWFIFRRIMWSVLFVTTAGVCIFMTMDKKRNRSYNTPSGIQTGRRYNSYNSRKRR